MLQIRVKPGCTTMAAPSYTPPDHQASPWPHALHQHRALTRPQSAGRAKTSAEKNRPRKLRPSIRLPATTASPWPSPSRALSSSHSAWQHLSAQHFQGSSDLFALCLTLLAFASRHGRLDIRPQQPQRRGEGRSHRPLDGRQLNAFGRRPRLRWLPRPSTAEGSPSPSRLRWCWTTPSAAPTRPATSRWQAATLTSQCRGMAATGALGTTSPRAKPRQTPRASTGTTKPSASTPPSP